MKYNQLGRTGLFVSEICLGTMTFGEAGKNGHWGSIASLDQEGANGIVRRALDSGVNFVDTANVYSNGLSEQITGQAIRNLGLKRSDVVLATKVLGPMGGGPNDRGASRGHIMDQVKASLTRLGTDHIDLFYMHRFDPKVPIADSVGAMVRAMEAGKIGAYGVSEWSAAHIREAHAVHPVAAVQPEYSLWTRNVELGVLDTCRELGIALVAFSPVGRGSLCGVLRDPATLDERDLRRLMPRFNADNWPHNLRLIEEFAALARDAGLAPAQLALAWILSRGDFLHAIPGTTSIPHLEENYAAGNLSVPQDVLDRAGALINQQTVAGHRYHEAIRPTIDTEEYA